MTCGLHTETHIMYGECACQKLPECEAKRKKFPAQLAHVQEEL